VLVPEYFDTHCHIHFTDYDHDPLVSLREAKESGVTNLMLVGCTLEDSRNGVAFAQAHGVYASIGLHPHEAHHYVDDENAQAEFRELSGSKYVQAIGECGLDYYYNHSPREAQVKLLRYQLEVAQQRGLPVIFHVRDAFEDFWQIFDSFQGITGVIHSFTAGEKELDAALERGLYLGLNGIVTFTKSASQLEAAKKVPLERLVLETDAPFLTPVPFRGKICEPKHVVETAKFLAVLRGESPEIIAAATTANALKLFGTKDEL